MMSTWDLEQLHIWLVDVEECKDKEEQGDPDWTCDGTLRLTKQWMDMHGVREDVNIPLLHAASAHCDCEALLNTHETDWPPQREFLDMVLEVYKPEKRAVVLEFYEPPEDRE